MEPAEIIAFVNRENAELQNQSHQLLGELQETRDQLSKARTLNDIYQYELQAQAFQIYVANETITNLSHHIYFLQSYIAHVEHQSDQAMRACRETTKYYEREIVAGRWSGHQWSQEAANLSSSARDLHHNAFANFKASNTSDEQKKDLIQKIMEIESTVLLKEIEKNNLKQTLEDNRARLKKVCITSSKMIETQNDLNRKLAETNVVLRSKAGKSARALRMAKDERESLQTKIKNAEEELQKCRETEEQLKKAIEREVQLERECQHSLAKAEDLRTSNDFYKRQDANQTQTIFNLKRLVANLQKTERNEGYIKTITTHKAEIAQLVANEVRLKDEVQKHQRIAIKALERMKEQIKIANEAKKEVATYKGHALATKHSLLVSLSHTKFELAMEIVDNVFKGLKDIDSEEKAKQAIHSINGYLEQQSKTVEDYTTNIMLNSAEVRGVIQDLQGHTPKEARPNEFGSFIDYVRGLQHTLEAEAKKWKNKLNV
ncbi:hypothetical protein COCSADRAFT_24535 [Bipolaris sorokiniana ND90Pr]|uniref:Uncharacterized protein n=1 Tax=Cochliobolus sativus (strain ND90Pr / ATCC 201652) TaxID=665912 RepID=M2SGR8_COCSN|nr:uncharacterized protein COCSADRAFT_24535 [Bipolaris sorokiniana ND90Pr]EMD66423.1 hypothetical protein COCSADRAFT_24535 [Bipolaris sorokiniana ND90Pr]